MQEAAPEIAKDQTSVISKQCTAHWTPSDFPRLIFWVFLMTSGGHKKAVKSGNRYTVHRKILTVGAKRKHPNKKAGKSVNRKIHRGRHLVQVHGAFRDKGTHSGSRCVVSYWHRVPLHSDILCVYVCESVNLSLCQLVCLTISIIGIINWSMESAHF